MKENKNIKKIVIAIVILVIILAVLICGFILRHSNSIVNKFKSNLEDNNIIALHDIYASTESYEEKKEMSKIFEQKLNSILEEYIQNNQDYDKTLEVINNYEDANISNFLIETAKENLEKIKNSKDEFSKAQNYETNGDIINAIISYSKVIELDKGNYEEAQRYINNNKEGIKKDTLAEVDELINKEDYITAKQKLNNLLLISPDDNIQQKLDEIEDKAKEQEIKKYKNEQEVTVESAKIIVQDEIYKSLYPDAIEVVIKNNSNKTIKDYNVAILAYDSNNYPLKIRTQFNYSGGDFEFTGKAENANIIAGATGGKDYGWELDQKHGISKVLAIVKDATYYDGSTWENPYYEYWIEQYKEKPLK